MKRFAKSSMQVPDECYTHASCPICIGQVLPHRSYPDTKSGKKAPAWIKAMRQLPCHYCGGPGGTIDHKIARCRGGRTVQENCVPACKPCNQFRGDRFYDEFKNVGWKERRFR